MGCEGVSRSRAPEAPTAPKTCTKRVVEVAMSFCWGWRQVGTFRTFARQQAMAEGIAATRRSGPAAGTVAEAWEVRRSDSADVLAVNRTSRAPCTIGYGLGLLAAATRPPITQRQGGCHVWLPLLVTANQTERAPSFLPEALPEGRRPLSVPTRLPRGTSPLGFWPCPAATGWATL